MLVLPYLVVSHVLACVLFQRNATVVLKLHAFVWFLTLEGIFSGAKPQRYIQYLSQTHTETLFYWTDAMDCQSATAHVCFGASPVPFNQPFLRVGSGWQPWRKNRFAFNLPLSLLHPGVCICKYLFIFRVHITIKDKWLQRSHAVLGVGIVLNICWRSGCSSFADTLAYFIPYYSWSWRGYGDIWRNVSVD